MENSFPYYFSTALIISYLIFGIIGAITIKILLTWANRTVRVLDLVRGAASWILGPLIVLFINTTFLADEGFFPLFAFYGFLIGFVIAIAMRACLIKANLMLSWRYVLISGAIWGFGFMGLLYQQIVGTDFQIIFMFLIFIIAGIGGSTALVIGLEKYRIANLTR